MQCVTGTFQKAWKQFYSPIYVIVVHQKERKKTFLIVGSYSKVYFAEVYSRSLWINLIWNLNRHVKNHIFANQSSAKLLFDIHGFISDWK